MSVSIKPLERDALGGLNILLYGDTGVGKTRFGATAAQHPDLKDLLVVDVDKGLHTISHLPDIWRVDVTTPSEVVELSRMAATNHADLASIRTVMIDSLSAFYQRDLEAIRDHETGKTYGKVTRTADTQLLGDYKEMTARITRLMRAFRTGKRHMILTAGVRDEGLSETNPSNFSKRRPDLTNQLWKEISHMMDMIWFVFRRQDGSINILVQEAVTAFNGVIHAKTRNEIFAAKLAELSARDSEGKPTNVICIGNVLNPSGEYPTIASLYNLYNEVT